MFSINCRIRITPKTDLRPTSGELSTNIFSVASRNNERRRPHALNARPKGDMKGMGVYEKRMLVKDNVEVYEMNNGLAYSKDAAGKWQVVY
jgi:hypothetical protein